MHCCCGCMRCGCGRAANVIMAAGPMLRASLQLRLQLRAARRLLQASLRLRPSQPPPFTHTVQQPLLPLLLLLHSNVNIQIGSHPIGGSFFWQLNIQIGSHAIGGSSFLAIFSKI